MVEVRLPGVVIATTGSPFALAKLVGFTDSADPRIESEARENGHGDYAQSDVYQAARYVTVEGDYYQQADEDLFAAGEVLKQLHGAEFEVEIVAGGRVYRSAVRLASKVSWDVDVAPGLVPFEFTLKADDPRWYGPLITQTVGVPSPGVGMSDPFTDPIDEGDPGNLGRIVCTNTGGAPTSPKVTIYGGVSEGFELLCMEHARVVRVTRPIPDGSHVTVDMGSGEVWIDDQSILPASYVPVSEWFEIGAGETCTIQWTPHGAQSGTPRMLVEHAEASW